MVCTYAWMNSHVNPVNSGQITNTEMCHHLGVSLNEQHSVGY